MSPNARIVGGRAILLFCVESKGPNMSSATVLTSLNIIVILHGAVKLMIKSTLLDWRPRKVNHTLTPSSVPIAKINTKQTQIYAPSGGIVSTKTSTTKNNKNFAKAEATQFA